MAEELSTLNVRSGCPIEVPTPVLKNNNEKMILEEIRVAIKEIPSKFNARVDTIHTIIYDDLNFHKACVRWVPKMLTPKKHCLRIS